MVFPQPARLPPSSSGGGLFDERPTTRARVWGRFRVLAEYKVRRFQFPRQALFSRMRLEPHKSVLLDLRRGFQLDCRLLFHNPETVKKCLPTRKSSTYPRLAGLGMDDEPSGSYPAWSTNVIDLPS